MSQKMQVGLLRVLQERTVRPVGASKEESVDVRVIAATHRDLLAMVSEGTFREDLFYRLQVVEVAVPPLRDRVEDIPPLIDHFLTRFSARYQRDRKSVSRLALRKLSGYRWPGNVRQLEHVLLGAWLMTEEPEESARTTSNCPHARCPPWNQAHASPTSVQAFRPTTGIGPPSTPTSSRSKSVRGFSRLSRPATGIACTPPRWSAFQGAHFTGA